MKVKMPVIIIPIFVMRRVMSQVEVGEAGMGIHFLLAQQGKY
jgi:hypothetical protein